MRKALYAIGCGMVISSIAIVFGFACYGALFWITEVVPFFIARGMYGPLLGTAAVVLFIAGLSIASATDESESRK